MNSKLKLQTKFCFSVIFIFVLFSPVYMKGLSKRYGVLSAESSSGVKDKFCMIYFPALGDMAPIESVAEFHILEDSSQTDWCDDHPEIDPQNKVLLLSPSKNCSVFDEVFNIQNRDGKGIIYLADDADLHIRDNKSDVSRVNITVGYIHTGTKRVLMKMDMPVKVEMFSPGERGFEYSLLIIFGLAIFTIVLGAYLSKIERYRYMHSKKNANGRRTYSSGSGNGSGSGVTEYTILSLIDEQTINVPVCWVFVMVIFMSGVLMLLYYFFNYLVYLLIGVFTLASIGSIYFVLLPLLPKIPFKVLKFKCQGCPCDLKNILLIAFAIGVAVFWVIHRNSQYGWILQDVLGIFFCLHFLRCIQLGNMKMCTCLLGLLFFYDIFFVFVTPYLTKKGMSVMEEVARGSNTTEMIPMVLKIMHFGYDSLSVCYSEFSLLGLGDILVPGLLVSYCMWFDEFTRKKKIYFWVSIVGYGVGMVCTYCGLLFMATAQPALLYLVPGCLLPPMIAAYCQGELSAIWTGVFSAKPASSNGPVQEGGPDKAPVAENATTEPITKATQEVPKTAEISHDEKNQLLK